MLRRGMMAAGGGGGGPVFTNDGTLSGWDGSSSNWSEDASVFSPTTPSLTTSTAWEYRYANAPSGRRFRVRMRTDQLCNFIFCANSSGNGSICRLETRGYNCGFSTIGSWASASIAQPAGGSAFASLSANTWYEFEVVVHPGNTADISVGGSQVVTGQAITNNGDYFGIKADGGSGQAWYDHIQVDVY